MAAPAEGEACPFKLIHKFHSGEKTLISKKEIYE